MKQTSDDAGAIHQRALAEFKKGNPTEALALIDRAIALSPHDPVFYNNRGFILEKLKRSDEALASLDRALSIRPDYANALNNRGNVLNGLKRYEEAVLSFDRAIALEPNHAEAHNNRGNGLQRLNRLNEALLSYDRALSVRPHYAKAYNNRGLTLVRLGRLIDALASYDRAVALDPNYADAHANRGDVLYDLKRFDDALENYDRALAINPDHPFLFGRRVFCKKRICDWQDERADFERLSGMIDRGEMATPLFAALASPLSAAQLKNCAERYINDIHPRSAVPVFPRRQGNDRIRLGYFSSDFWNHPVAQLIAGLIEHHDRTRFEVIGFSLNQRKMDPMRARLQRAFDRFIEFGGLSDVEAVNTARSLEIDLAVDLNGFTTNARTNLFAMGLATIQVNYLGYPGTMGADYFDYIIADPIVIPEGEEQHFVEKIVRLPGSYQPSDSKRPISDRQFSRSECGLPDEGVVFCCFNNHYKIAPAIFDVWMRLLQTIRGSALWLPTGADAAIRNLRKEAQARGVDPSRLVFASFLPDIADHLARLKLADLFLDTLPFNAHTTASDALWAGVPLLTCLGETLQGRVAASLLDAAGLPELATKTLADYEALALELATSPQRLLLVKQRLASQRFTKPLFDTAQFTRHIERAYCLMWERHLAGLIPDHITVAPS